MVEPGAGLRVGTYEDAGLTGTKTDRYGHRLTYTTPAELRWLEVPDDIDPWNKAVLAFLLDLPAYARIVLF
jgi:hypothetical protein